MNSAKYLRKFRIEKLYKEGNDKAIKKNFVIIKF